MQSLVPFAHECHSNIFDGGSHVSMRLSITIFTEAELHVATMEIQDTSPTANFWCRRWCRFGLFSWWFVQWYAAHHPLPPVAPLSTGQLSRIYAGGRTVLQHPQEVYLGDRPLFSLGMAGIYLTIRLVAGWRGHHY